MKNLTAMLTEYHDWRRGLNQSAETLYTQGRDLVTFITWLARVYGVTTADRLQRRHLHAYQLHLVNYRTAKGLPLRPGSINNRVKAVHGFLRFLSRRSYVAVDLSDAIEYVKEPRLLPTSVLTHAEVRKLLAKVDTTDALGYRNRAILELLYSTGMRRGELLGLQVGDVDIENGVAKVTGKGRKERIVPIGRTALRFLETYLKAIRPLWTNSANTTALFLGKYGRPLERNGLAWLIREECSIPPQAKVTPHTFRRSCTTELVRNNANLYHVKELLGHESLATLTPYTRLTIMDLKKTHAKCHPRERDERQERG